MRGNFRDNDHDNGNDHDADNPNHALEQITRCCQIYPSMSIFCGWVQNRISSFKREENIIKVLNEDGEEEEEVEVEDQDENEDEDQDFGFPRRGGPTEH